MSTICHPRPARFSNRPAEYRPSRIPNYFTNPRRCARPQAADGRQGNLVGGYRTFDRAELVQQATGDRGTDARQALQHEESPRRETFRLPVEAAQDLISSLADLIGQESKGAQ